eukprot:963525-Lingulodinium_polyedra.AAC.1
MQNPRGHLQHERARFCAFHLIINARHGCETPSSNCSERFAHFEHGARVLAKNGEQLGGIVA